MSYSLVATKRAAARLGDGRLGVIVPAARLPEFGQAISDAVPGAAAVDQPELDRPVVVLTVEQAKGLEFDSVLIGDPAGILAESPRGLNDLYVALTRATQQLGVVHAGDLPAVLARLRPSDDAVPAQQRSA